MLLGREGLCEGLLHCVHPPTCLVVRPSPLQAEPLRWERLLSRGTTPDPRQEHSAVVWEDDSGGAQMVVFGGQLNVRRAGIGLSLAVHQPVGHLVWLAVLRPCGLPCRGGTDARCSSSSRPTQVPTWLRCRKGGAPKRGTPGPGPCGSTRGAASQRRRPSERALELF